MRRMYQNPQTEVTDLSASQILLTSGESASLIGNVEDKHPVHHKKGQ